ncbi:hypothetical protein [uncultured Dokdonia sp.]|uniref:hypothetical protein n=1 Tax=uncultured Dokdonia sp. TaxID=575653 RepID=UPI00262C7AE4|nr:hypothetical protein [uncultured Dokdonia sp.]
MSFLKNLFKGKKPKQTSKNDSKVGINTIATSEYFDKRYQEDTVDTAILEGTLKMIEAYFPANKIQPVVEKPINHPKNLDQTIDDGFGFVMYCKAMDMDESYAVGLLAMAFNDFMIKHHNFKLYKDSEPEYPLRGMTLKYDNQGAKLSLYPIEYATKVINYEANFTDLYERIKGHVTNMPSSDEVFNKLMKGLDNNHNK